MSWAVFLVLILNMWGIRMDVHPWFQQAVPVIRFVDARELNGGQVPVRSGVCGAITMMSQHYTDGRPTHRWATEIRLVTPDSVPWCPHEALPGFIEHELWCHLFPYVAEGQDDTSDDHSKAGCGQCSWF